MPKKLFYSPGKKAKKTNAVLSDDLHAQADEECALEKLFFLCSSAFLLFFFGEISAL